MPAKVFYSYAHEDEGLRDRLETQLALLRRKGVISEWHDRQISAGATWSQVIDDRLNTSDVILLLVSPDFLASDYSHEIEVKGAMERHCAGKALVIPVILRPVDWKGALFDQLQALPKNGKAVTTWQNIDEAFKDVAEGIRKALDGLGRNDPSLKAAVSELVVERIESFRPNEQSIREALKLYEDRIPDDQKIDREEMVRLVERHLSSEFGPTWK
ncbi:MAG: toll/interleukin-1 receptor domain-containing protein, partial [Bryobacteraceae bacterium]